MFPHQRKELLHQAFDEFSSSVIASGDDALRRWLVEVSTCILLSHEWEALHRFHRLNIIRRLSLASKRMQQELGRVGICKKLPAELAQFASAAPHDAMLNIYRQTFQRARQNIQDCGALYPEERVKAISSPA